MKLRETETIAVAAAKAGMSERTARKYLKCSPMPSEMKRPRDWRTRSNPFADVWATVESLLDSCPGIESKTIFEELQRKHPGRFQDGQIRTLQRRVRDWRATEGPPKEVFFPQVYIPGRMGSFDFTHMNELGITIEGRPFPHMLFHFVLPYSNWETGNVCFSESFDSLSDGLQKALHRLGAVPEEVRSDRLSAAINNLKDPKEFTERYTALLKHYGLRGVKTNPGSGHENGDVEQSHHRLKSATEQSLLLRGSRDFNNREEYAAFIDGVIESKNVNRAIRLSEEKKKLRPLPAGMLNTKQMRTVKVSRYSTIHINKNAYSVDSRLIGETVRITMDSEWIEVRHGLTLVEKIPRIAGKKGHFIQYRHVIDSLVRKPGAFTNYRYHEDMFPTTRFRIAYDTLRAHGDLLAAKIYTRILHLAAKESESRVDAALRILIDGNMEISLDAVRNLIQDDALSSEISVTVDAVDLSSYDMLLYTEAAS